MSNPGATGSGEGTDGEGMDALTGSGRDFAQECMGPGADIDQQRHTFPPSCRERVLGKIRSCLESHPEIMFAYIHGSFLEDLPYRDVDVAVYYRQDLSPEQQLDMSLDLSVELSHVLSVRIDVHSLNTAPVEFRYHAARGVLLFTRDKELTFDFQEDTWARYFDFQPFLRESLNDLLS